MTDNEIIKAIEICAQNSVTRHNGLTYQGMPLHFLFEEILGFVNRQTAENERLNTYLDVIGYSTDKIKSEAVKEFAERLHEKLSTIQTAYNARFGEMIDNLVKEFTEGEQE